MSENGHHVLPMKVYVTVFGLLLVLTVLTVAVAQIDFGGGLNAFIAMFVATIKAALVALYFMHLKYDDKLNAVCLVSGFFFLIVMYAFSATDIYTRVLQDSTL